MFFFSVITVQVLKLMIQHKAQIQRFFLYLVLLYSYVCLSWLQIPNTAIIVCNSRIAYITAFFDEGAKFLNIKTQYPCFTVDVNVSFSTDTYCRHKIIHFRWGLCYLRDKLYHGVCMAHTHWQGHGHDISTLTHVVNDNFHDTSNKPI